MQRLGTETAFAVSAEAGEWSALGHTVYPFHLGDLDLPTPQNVVEATSRAALTGDQSRPVEIVRTLRERRDVAVDLLNRIPGVSCYRPEATFYLFPDVTELMEHKELETCDQLRRAALEQAGVSFCTRLHFGRALPGEERRYVRLAYSGISAELIAEGLGRLKEWAQ